MVASAASARVQYLHAAASLISNSAPVVSSVLQVEHLQLTSTLGITPSDLLHRHSELCTACGSCLGQEDPSRAKPESPNLNSTSSRRRKRSQKLRGSSTADGIVESASRITLICERCHRRTRVPVQLPNKASKSNSSRPAMSGSTNDETSNPSQSTVVTAAEPKATLNASSKKRAKARKQGGLQAILATSISPATTKPGFDLMDFMKSA